jgi:hypothetical protein
MKKETKTGIYLTIIVHLVGIYGLLYGVSCFELLQVFHHKFPVYGLGVVKVQLLSFFQRQVGVVFVIRILRYYGDLAFIKGFQDFIYHGCFSGTGSSGNANNQHS